LVQVVNALKALQRSLVYGEDVSRLLQASPVWAQYEQQRHDLFIQVSHTERRKRTR
jgi:DnaJ family protein C protein 13